MARNEATKDQKQTTATLIVAGKTEMYYFKHLQEICNFKAKARPRFTGKENISELEKRIEQVLVDDGVAIVVFDADVSTWNDVEEDRLRKLKQKYDENEHVILCDSMPSVEFWFLIHFANTNKFFGTSKAVMTELIKYIPNFQKKESFLSSPKWVKEMCKNGRLEEAFSRAKRFGLSEGFSYTNMWKAFEYLGICK